MEESALNGAAPERPSEGEGVVPPSHNGDEAAPAPGEEPEDVAEQDAETPPEPPALETEPVGAKEPAPEEPPEAAEPGPPAEHPVEPEPAPVFAEVEETEQTPEPVVESELPAPEVEVTEEETPEPAVEAESGEPEPAAAEAEEPEPAAEPEPALAAAEPSPELAAAVEEAFEGVEEAEALPEWVPGEWFVVHTYAGYENKVKTNLESRISSMSMEEKIFEVVIPMEDVMEIKSGKKQVVQRKVFPGYLLVRMDLDDDSWYVVRNTPGVTGFVGSGSKPIPLSMKEVDRILQRKGVEEKVRPRLEFQAGDGVRVTMGPFANFQGVISEIDADRSKLKVLVNIFGRETPVELGFDQVAKL
jgi:transcriptional antiterminator NusG